MSHATETYTADAELAALLAAARESGKRVRIRADGQTYELEVKSPPRWVDPYAGHSVEEIREALEKASGFIIEDEAERVKLLIYEAREQGAHPLDRSHSSLDAYPSTGESV